MSVPKPSILLIIIILMGLPVFASPPSKQGISETKIQLKALARKMNQLQQTLATAHDKKGALNQELSVTEKQIGEGVRQLRSINNNIKNKEERIGSLQKRTENLALELITQQQLLASHVRARYQMGEYQPLKWLINQDDPYNINRILTYYLYVVKSRQRLIEHIDITREHLSKNKEQLHVELAQLHQLQNQLNQHQKQLQHDKSYHTTLISTLDNSINSNQNVLNDFQRDKQNLSALLSSLAQPITTQNSQSFEHMRKKLPPPIQGHRRSVEKMNQGVTFFAEEGTPATAVYPGRVVFSDWLKGYGLLLIVDHGEGFMTLYAHNQSLLKHKGDLVNQNEPICIVGHSGGIKQNGLYFEIRLRGKAIPPLAWLS